jgi:disulfide bond formation protein DsbB
MTPFVQNVTDIFSFGTFVLDILAAALLFILITPLRKHGVTKDIADFFGERAIFLSFLVALAATAGSLFYSEIAGFQPCLLCWWQRIFLYPQTILLFTAFMKKDESMRLHSLILSGLGALIAVYHTFIQFGGESALPCAANGGVSCHILYFLEYGYITIPTMSLTVFALILIFMSAPNPKKREINEL